MIQISESVCESLAQIVLTCTADRRMNVIERAPKTADPRAVYERSLDAGRDRKREREREKARRQQTREEKQTTPTGRMMCASTKLALRSD